MLEWSRPYPVWLYGLLAVAFGVVILAARWMSISPRLRNWVLFVPRAALLGVLLTILLNPVRRDELKLPSQPPTIAYLVDCSRSMALDEPVSRIDQVKQVLQQAEGMVTGNDRPRVQLYRFGSQLSVAPDMAGLQPIEEASRLDTSLERLPSRFSTDLPRGVFVISDGTFGKPFRAQELGGIYKRLGIPVHVFPVGSERIRGDVAIQELVVPRRADKGAKVPIRTVVRSQGFAGQRVVVQVNSADRPQTQPLASLPITLTGGPQSVDLVVEANPDFGELVLEVPALDGEAIVKNNRVPFQLATASRKIKVLYMEGTGGQEYRWLHNALIEDKDIQCVSLIADQQYVQRQRLQRVDDPYKGFPATREELLQYDCVICSDIALGAFTREQLEWTVELVAQRGGGFAMVGGITSFGAGNWDQTAWDKLIPVDMTGGQQGRGWVYHTFNVRIPPEAEKHPIWRILDDVDQNKAALAKMPPFLGANFIQRLKPAATALAFSDKPIPGAGIMPIFATESYGRGRTFAFAPDTTADWGRLFESQWGIGDNRYFRRFWRNVVRWLSENSAGGNRRLLVETDRIIYRTGQPIELTARAFDASLHETTDYQLIARFKTVDSDRTAPQAAAVSLAPIAASKSYAGNLEALPALSSSTQSSQELAGLVARDVEIVALDKGKEVARTTVKVQLLHDSQELLEPQPVHANLTLLADVTGGRVLHTAREVAELLQNLPSKAGDKLVTRSPVWDRTSVWLMLMLLLTTEWVLRRLAGFG